MCISMRRKIGEAFVLGKGKNKIVITLLEMDSEQAKLGIEAPEEISIYRKEIYDRAYGSKNDAG